MDPHKRSFGLDFTRTLAIAFVLLAHFAKNNKLFAFWGVEIFFGLSGFLIGQILWRNFVSIEKWSLPHVVNFWSRRWWRTLPNYYLFLLVSIVFHYLYNHHSPDFGELFKFLWFGQNLIGSNRDFYGVSWSLCIEEWVYLLFPLVLFTYSKLIANKNTSYILTLVTFFTGCLLFRYYMITIGKTSLLETLTLGRLDAIACGVAVSYAFIIHPSGILKKQLAFALGFILLMLPVILIYGVKMSAHSVNHNPLVLMLVPLGASLMLPIVSLWEGAHIPNFIADIIEKISLWSYSLYLCHIPILFTVYSLMGSVRNGFIGNLMSKVIGLALAILVSKLLFTYFELPFTRKRPKELKA